MPIFDTHAHYDSGGFNGDRDQVLSALPAAGPRESFSKRNP